MGFSGLYVAFIGTKDTTHVFLKTITGLIIFSYLLTVTGCRTHNKSDAVDNTDEAPLDTFYHDHDLDYQQMEKTKFDTVTAN
jgi:hypothetical protein